MRLSWTPPALDDLRAIDFFLTSRSPASAARVLEAILAKSRLLERFPAAGPAFDGDIRAASVSHTPYSLLYRVLPDSVQILRIRHEREDWR